MKFDDKKLADGCFFYLSHEFVRSSMNRSLFIKLEDKTARLFKTVI
jgi:hypothetical protein